MTGDSRERRTDDDRRGPPPPRHSQAALIAGFVVLAALIIAVAYWVWSEQTGSMRAQAEANLVAVSELQADEVAAWLRERDSDAESVRDDRLLAAAAQQLLLGTADSRTEADIRARLASLQRSYGYVDVVLSAPDGHILLREPPTVTHPLGASAKATIAAAIRTKRVQSTDLYRAEDGQIRIEWAAPLLPDGPGGSAVGAVLLHADPEGYLYPLLEEWPIPTRTGESLLVERRGDKVLFLTDLRHREGAALEYAIPLARSDLPAAQAVQGTHGVATGNDYRGVEVLAAAQPVAGSPWYIIAKVDADEVLGPIARRGWMTAAFAFVTVALAGAGTLLLWRRRESQVAAELITREQEFSSLFDGMMEGVATHELVRDASGAPIDYLILDVNPAFVEQTGLAADDVRGHLGSEVYPGEAPPFLEAYTQAVGTGERQRREAYVDSIGRHLQVSVTPQGGERCAAIFDDITDRVAAEQEISRLNTDLEQRVADRTAELAAANKELEAFAYSVSHDLRAPLRHVSGFSALLAARAGDDLDEKSRHYVERISSSVGEMGTLIDDLLAFSRTGRKELSIDRVDMDELVTEALTPLRDETRDRAVDWAIAPLPAVTGDRALLRQVWANLLGNAVKYTRGRATARIEVGTYEDDHADVFCVRDNGVGFDMKYAHKLFGVFQRLHSSAEFEGTGIGLANVQRVVARHGGRVWAEGKPDEGAAFYFSLPRRKEPSS